MLTSDGGGITLRLQSDSLHVFSLFRRRALFYNICVAVWHTATAGGVCDGALWVLMMGCSWVCFF